MIEKCLKLFAKLRTDRGRVQYPEITYHRAPHKPFLLLPIIDLIAQGRIGERGGRTSIFKRCPLSEQAKVDRSRVGLGCERELPVLLPFPVCLHRQTETPSGTRLAD